MFKELLPLVEDRTIVLTIAKTGENTLCVNFIPKAKDGKENSALAVPLTVEGTAEELDLELPGLLSQYTARAVAFRSNLDSVSKQFADALAHVEADNKKKLDEKKGKKPTCDPATGKPAPAPAA